MGSVRTSILGRPRRLPRYRRAAQPYTLNCEEPHNLWALLGSSAPLRTATRPLVLIQRIEGGGDLGGTPHAAPCRCPASWRSAPGRAGPRSFGRSLPCCPGEWRPRLPARVRRDPLEVGSGTHPAEGGAHVVAVAVALEGVGEHRAVGCSEPRASVFKHGQAPAGQHQDPMRGARLRP